MAASNSPSAIVLYDIDMRPPCAPNPWKARYALNFKGVSYSTAWVDMPNISKTRCELGVPASRKFADGTDYYTLPVLTDSTSSSKLGDSFDIAVYLQKAYPNTGAGNLLPEQKLDYVYGHDLAVFAPLSELNGNEHADYACFNMNVDAAFSAHVLLMVHGLPFKPDTAEETKAEFVRRSGVASWDDLTVRGEKRDEMKKSLHDTLKTMAELFQRNRTGPFLLGEQPNYADLIVGAWLQMMHGTLPAEEWDEIKTWHEGVFGNLHNALQKYALVN